MGQISVWTTKNRIKIIMIAYLKEPIFILFSAFLILSQTSCSKGNYVGPESAQYLATAAQEDCGYLQNDYGQRVSWKDRVPVEFFVSKTIPTEFHADILEAADIWNKSAGKKLIVINLTDLEGTQLSTDDQKNVIYGMQEWDEGKSTQQALTIVKYRRHKS
jgi:hypothetical protein